MTTNELDQDRSEAFAERMIGVLNDGALALMTNIGHRTGLFAVMARLLPSTSPQIVAAANLNERYVREWLAAMVTGGVVEHDPEGETYRLPLEHAAWLTRAAPPDNIAVAAQFVPMLASVEDRIVECFRKGGRVPYSAFERFHEVMAEEDSGQTVVSVLTDHILPLVPGLTRCLEEGIDVMDVGCGSGRVLNLLARKFPNSRFVGYDFSEETITRARAEAAEQGTSNVRYEVRDAAIDEEERYDLITTFDAIHDQARPAAVLNRIGAALEEDGVYLMQDIAGSSHLHNNMDHPLGRFTYTVSTMHCMTVSLAQGGEGLGTMWGEEKALEMLKEAGFEQVEVKQLPHDFQNNYYIVMKV